MVLWYWCNVRSWLKTVKSAQKYLKIYSYSLNVEKYLPSSFILEYTNKQNTLLIPALNFERCNLIKHQYNGSQWKQTCHFRSAWRDSQCLAFLYLNSYIWRFCCMPHCYILLTDTWKSCICKQASMGISFEAITFDSNLQWDLEWQLCIYLETNAKQNAPTHLWLSLFLRL